jgi:hypothetical protein
MPLQNHIEQHVTDSEMVTTTEGDAILLDGVSTLSLQCVVDVDTPSAEDIAAEDVDATEDTLTIEGHGYTTGLKGQMTTSDADLPSGLSTATDYFVIVIDDDTIQLANSLSNALAGTEIDLSDAGTGTHTFTPTALAGGSVKIQKSNVAKPSADADWTDVAAATNITADGSTWLEDDAPGYKWVRYVYTLTAGRMSAVTHIIGKGPH